MKFRIFSFLATPFPLGRRNGPAGFFCQRSQKVTVGAFDPSTIYGWLCI